MLITYLAPPWLERVSVLCGSHEKGRTNVSGALLGGVLLTGSLFQTTANIFGFHAWILQDLIPKLPEKQWGIHGQCPLSQKPRHAQDLESFKRHSSIFSFIHQPLNLIKHKWAQKKALRHTPLG
ncbi:hypothetical protein [Holospora undulata]|nr:hypothetical protein [Holospora undulata]